MLRLLHALVKTKDNAEMILNEGTVQLLVNLMALAHTVPSEAPALQQTAPGMPLVRGPLACKGWRQ